MKKTDCITHLQKKETIYQAINRLATLEESYKIYWMLAEKSKGTNQGTDHAKILRSKAQTAVDRALHLLALESNMEEGSIKHTVANSRTKCRIRVVMSHQVLWEPTKKQTQVRESKKGMVKEGNKPMGNRAGLSDKDRSTVEDGMPKPTKT